MHTLNTKQKGTSIMNIRDMIVNKVDTGDIDAEFLVKLLLENVNEFDLESIIANEYPEFDDEYESSFERLGAE